MSRVLIIIDGQSVQKHHQRTGKKLNYENLICAIVDHLEVDGSKTYYFGRRAQNTTAQDSFINLLKNNGIITNIMPWAPEGLDMRKIDEVVSNETFDVLVIMSSAPRAFEELIKKVRITTGVMVISLNGEDERWGELVDEVRSLRELDRNRYGIIKKRKPQRPAGRHNTKKATRRRRS